MSRSGSRYRDPFNIDARRRKGAPHEPKKRKRIEELTEKELEDQLHQEEHRRFDNGIMESRCFRD